MKSTLKVKKFNKFFEKHLSNILIKEFTCSGNIITITCIHFSLNANLAKIFISTFDKSEYIVKILNNSSNKIRYDLSTQIKISRIPKLIFIYDSQDRFF